MVLHLHIINFVKDHLGNIRVVINQDGSTVEQTNSYYPFGGIFASTGEGEQPYKFSGKEFDKMHGLDWYDFSARTQDPGVPRFTTMDPLAEKYPWLSPYVYCRSNPIRYIDLTGMYFDEANEKKAKEIEKKIEKQIKKLEKQISKLEKKEKDTSNQK